MSRRPRTGAPWISRSPRPLCKRWLISGRPCHCPSLFFLFESALRGLPLLDSSKESFLEERQGVSLSLLRGRGDGRGLRTPPPIKNGLEKEMTAGETQEKFYAPVALC